LAFVDFQRALDLDPDNQEIRSFILQFSEGKDEARKIHHTKKLADRQKEVVEGLVTTRARKSWTDTKGKGMKGKRRQAARRHGGPEDPVIEGKKVVMMTPPDLDMESLTTVPSSLTIGRTAWTVAGGKCTSTNA